MMDTKDIPKAQLRRLKRYLKERGIYHQFRHEAPIYVSRKYEVPLSKRMEEVTKYTGCEHIINYCLYWRKTFLGHGFWSREDSAIWRAHDRGLFIVSNGQKFNLDTFAEVCENYPMLLEK